MLTLRKLHRTIALSPKEETSVRAEVLLRLLSLHDGSARRFPESTVCNVDSFVIVTLPYTTSRQFHSPQLRIQERISSEKK
ncbi:hypothetical protein HBH70_122540 [Parastagonospora nodorum]|nr:hypothetical protein HBH53_139910 [Parastagonospora nodorum]KAH4197964.1 hypothetical protein HBH42_064120 [Parastagonospora nodorum]KAH4311611.1 hypothetical protein HBI01_011900 [Parastagonospora nodorum]KAH4316628.1 hypothetical protein HBI02_028220 [Parastagonospora nodorum]KAH4328291.1 hypothetical protein HBI00_111320 [Parastagonospora nodorum]